MISVFQCDLYITFDSPCLISSFRGKARAFYSHLSFGPGRNRYCKIHHLPVARKNLSRKTRSPISSNNSLPSLPLVRCSMTCMS